MFIPLAYLVDLFFTLHENPEGAFCGLWPDRILH